MKRDEALQRLQSIASQGLQVLRLLEGEPRTAASEIEIRHLTAQLRRELEAEYTRTLPTRAQKAMSIFSKRNFGHRSLLQLGCSCCRASIDLLSNSVNARRNASAFRAYQFSKVRAVRSSSRSTVSVLNPTVSVRISLQPKAPSHVHGALSTNIDRHNSTLAFHHFGSARTTDVSICLSGMDQYRLRSRFFCCVETIRNPFFS